MARLAIKVVPDASHEGIAGWLGEALKIRVTAPPEQGKANAAVCRLLADALAIPLDQIRIVSGHGNPRKVVEVEGMDEAALRQRVDDLH